MLFLDKKEKLFALMKVIIQLMPSSAPNELNALVLTGDGPRSQYLPTTLIRAYNRYTIWNRNWGSSPQALFSLLKTQTDVGASILKAECTVVREDYTKHRDLYSTLKNIAHRLNLMTGQALLNSLAHPQTVSDEFKKMPMLIYQLRNFLSVHGDYLDALMVIIDVQDRIESAKLRAEFIAVMPKHFKHIKEKIIEDYNGNQSRYARPMEVFNKCELCFYHIEELVNSAAQGKAHSERIVIDAYKLPEGLLWHPEKFNGQPELARLRLTDVVLQYVQYFMIAKQYKRTYEFFDQHTTSACFELTMDQLTDWIVSNRFLKNGFTLDTSSLGESREVSDVSQAEIDEQSPLATLKKYYSDNKALLDTDIIRQHFENNNNYSKETINMLLDFSKTLYALISQAASVADDSKGTADFIDQLTKNIPDDDPFKPKIKRWVHLYYIKAGIIDDESGLSDYEATVVDAESVNKQCKPSGLQN